MGKKVGGVLVGLVILGGFFGYRIYNKSVANKEAKEAVLSWVSDAPGYKENQAYFDSLIDTAHEKAFDESYSLGGRRRSSSFDVDKYGQLVFSSMKAKAESDGRAEIAKTIQAVWTEFANRQSAEQKDPPQEK